jgi:hypothetical protein
MIPSNLNRCRFEILENNKLTRESTDLSVAYNLVRWRRGWEGIVGRRRRVATWTYPYSSSKRVPGAELRHRHIPGHGVGKCGIARTIVHGCTGSSIKPTVSGDHGVVGAARKASTCGARNAMGQRIRKGRGL